MNGPELADIERRNRRVGYLAGGVGFLTALVGFLNILANYAISPYLFADWRIVLPAPFSQLLPWLPLLGMLLGVYVFSWGLALVGQHIWGLYSGTISFGLLALYLLLAAWLWIDPTGGIASLISASRRVQVIVLLVLVGAAALAVWMTYWLGFNDDLRKAYSARYARRVPPSRVIAYAMITA